MIKHRTKWNRKQINKREKLTCYSLENIDTFDKPLARLIKSGNKNYQYQKKGGTLAQDNKRILITLGQ